MITWQVVRWKRKDTDEVTQYSVSCLDFPLPETHKPEFDAVIFPVNNTGEVPTQRQRANDYAEYLNALEKRNAELTIIEAVAQRLTKP